MSITIRSALTIIAALSASQVAPAQLTQPAEPLIANGSKQFATPTVLQPIKASVELPATATMPPIASEANPVDEEASVDPAATLEEKVAQLRAADPGDKQMECLAAGIYFESKSESLAGQLAVGQVIANRADSGRFPSSYCGVLFQRGQFSFVRGKSYPSVPRASRQWRNAVAIAKIVDQALHVSSVPKALFFHAKRVAPRWRLTRVGSVGNHVFYR